MMDAAKCHPCFLSDGAALPETMATSERHWVKRTAPRRVVSSDMCNVVIVKEVHNARTESMSLAERSDGEVTEGLIYS